MTTPEELDALQERLENLRLLARGPGDPIREPRRSHIARYHDALAKAWEGGAFSDLRARVAELVAEVHALQEAVNAEEERANDANIRATAAEARVAELEAENKKLALTEVIQVWTAGEPPSHIREEWFIAKTIHGERVVLRSLPEGWSYDYTTADHTYMAAENIVAWMQMPDSEYISHVEGGAVAAEAVARAEAAEAAITTLRARVAELEGQAEKAITTSCNAIAAMDKALAAEQEMAQIASNAIIELSKETARATTAEAELARLRQGVQETGVRDQNGRMICVGDTIRIDVGGKHTRREYWCPEYEVIFDAPRFTLRHIGGDKDSDFARWNFRPSSARKIETIRAALVSPGDGWTPPPEDQRPEGYRCLAMVEMVWEREFTGGMGWHRPDDQMMYRIEEGVPGTHGFLPLPAQPASEGGA